jgi:AraC-like DNA-binding protein
MPYRIDLFAVFIFLGIVQAIFLSFFFLYGENRKRKSNFFHGLLLISMAGCILEIFLMYTGYIVDCLYMVDFSEPLSFLIGPCFYLMVMSLTRPSISKKQYWHFAFAGVYLILVLPFFLQPETVKYNSWIESFQPNLPFRPYDYDRGDPRMFWITDHHTLLTFISLLLYIILTAIEVYKAFKQKHESFWRPTNQALKNIQFGAIQLAITLAIMLVIKMFNPNDTGDHILAAYISVIIYLTSFRVVSQSGFFKQSLDEHQKYKSSSITPDLQQHTLKKLMEVMDHDKPYLKPDFSLPDLARQVNVSVHTLSQVINEGLQKSFFEMTAAYRIEEAKKLLKSQPNFKIEEIAEQVGYNSKSSFNTSFKKITGKTPSEFRSL